MQRRSWLGRIASSAVALGVAATAAAAQAPEHPDQRPTVAVMYFTNGAIGAAHGELAPLSKGIADLLITELSANPNIRVVERAQLQRLLEEQDLSTADRVDPQTAVRLGRVLGAHHMIFGGFVTDPKGNMRLDVRAVDVQTSRVEFVETVTDRTDNFFAMLSRLAAKMNAGLELPAIPAAIREASGERAKKLPFQAAILYSRAIAAEDQGQREQAVELYRAVLDKFPENVAARKALHRLQPPAGN